MRIDLREGLADVRLIRADKMNARHDAMFARSWRPETSSRRKKAYAGSCFRAKDEPSAPAWIRDFGEIASGTTSTRR